MGRACHAVAALLTAWRLVILAGAPATEASAEAACAAGSFAGSGGGGTDAPPSCPEEHDGASLLQSARGRGGGPAAAAGDPANASRLAAPGQAPDAAATAAGQRAPHGALPARGGAAAAGGAPAPPAAPWAPAAAGGGGQALLELLRQGAAGAGGGAGPAAPVFAVALVMVAVCGAAYLALGALAPSEEPREVLASPAAARTVADLGQASRHSLPAAVAASMRSLRSMPPARPPGSAFSLHTGAPRSAASTPTAAPCGGRSPQAGYPWPPPGPRFGGASREDLVVGAPPAASGALSPPAPAPHGHASPGRAPVGARAQAAPLPHQHSSPRLASVASLGPRRSNSPVEGGGPLGLEGQPQRRSSSPLSVLWPALVAPGRGGHMEVAVPDILAAAASGGSFFVIGPLGTKVLRALVEGPDDGRRLSLSPAGDAAGPRAVVAPSQRQRGSQGPGRSDGHAEMDIFGPEGKRFGVLVKRPGGPHIVRRPGQEVPAVVVNGDPGDMRLTATAGDGRPLASTSRALRTGGGPEHLQVWAQPGADTVLVLACMLSVILPM